MYVMDVEGPGAESTAIGEAALAGADDDAAAAEVSWDAMKNADVGC